MKIFFTFLFAHACLFAAEQNPEDSIKSFKVAEIMVGSDKTLSKVNESSITKIPYRLIQATDIQSVANLQLMIPSGVIRNNSRGESMLFMRGAAERQLAVFFDGMPLNVPWDNRADLSFVPADIIGQINVSNNTSSMFYGANILGGVFEINSLERINNGQSLSVRSQLNHNGGLWSSTMYEYKDNAFSSVINASYLSSPGFALPSDIDSSLYLQNLNNDGTKNHLINNTQQNRINLFTRNSIALDSNNTLALTLNFTSDDKGVQSISNKAFIASGEAQRNWIYPERQRFFAILNYHSVLSDDFVVKSTLWYDKYQQQIDDYGSNNDFKSIVTTQNDIDNTLGGRLIAQYRLSDKHFFNFAANFLSSEHEERIDGVASRFSQNTLSTGIDYNWLFDSSSIHFGVAYDHNSTPLTGNFTTLEGNSDDALAFFVNYRQYPNKYFSTFGSFSFRSRFPSMREALSGALNRFLPNPDLRPETVLSSDYGFIMENEYYKYKFTSFVSLYRDLIVQSRLSSEQDSLRRRVRINRDAAFIYGFEQTLSINSKNWFFNVNFCYILDNNWLFDSPQDTLDNRPYLTLGALIRYNINSEASVQLEQDILGEQYQLAGNYYSVLPTTALTNLRINYKMVVSDSYLVELFLRANNLFDTFRESALGLIDPGRTLTFGAILRL